MTTTGENVFMMSHVFKDIPNLKTTTFYIGEEENHFNAPWQICLQKKKSGVVIAYLVCHKSCTSEWSITTKIMTNLIPKTIENLSEEQYNQNFVFHSGTSISNFPFVYSSTDVEKRLIDGNLTVTMYVKIDEMTGAFKEKLRNFDESAKEFSDVVLIVNDEKFYVLKKFLASHCSYFKSLFLGNFEESQKSEITLNNINRWDFQNFLEVINGEPAMHEETVGGILHLADMYDSKTAMRQCETFLVEKSEKSMAKKFRMAVKYNLDNLKKKCLSELKTVDDICSILPEDIYQFDQSVYVELIRKAQSLK